MRKYLLIAAALLGIGLLPARAADSTVAAMSAASALGGTELLYCVQGGADRKCTPVQLAAYIFGAVSGDLTCNGTGTCILKNTGPGATGPIGSTTVIPVVTIDAQGRVTALGTATAAGTVASIATSCGTTGGPITTTGTISAQVLTRAGTGTTDTILAADCGNRVTESNAAAIAVTLPQATGSFTTGYFTEIVNLGAGLVTVTPTTSTIDGVASITLAQFQSIVVVSDGTNYSASRGRVPNGLFTVTGALKGSGVGVVTQAGCADLSNGAASCSTDATNASNIGSGTLAAARGGAGTINGALKGNGSGVVSQAACTDLSDDGALCSATPGTGVATAIAANLSASGGLTTTIASGAKALATSAISSAACSSAQTDTATNTATTDTIIATFNGDPTAVTGYVPLTTGMLTIIAYPTANTVNFKVCNNTNASITPGAITLNWRVVR